MFEKLRHYLALKINNFVLRGTYSRQEELKICESRIREWEYSAKRLMQIKGVMYYAGDQDILMRKRMAIGKNGELEVLENLPNNRIVDNQYRKLVDQKTNYLVGKPLTIRADSEEYEKKLNEILNRKFMRTLKNSVKAAYNGGIAWLYPYCQEDGGITFMLFNGDEILPFWRDTEHTVLESALRLYTVEEYEGTSPKLVKRVEIFDRNGIHRYIYRNGLLFQDYSDTEGKDMPHIVVKGGDEKAAGLNWERVPLIPVRCNSEEIPLLKRVKSLQDGINIMLSDFENNMQEDARNTILVLKNYDGTDLGEFRRNLSTYAAVKVRDDDTGRGGVETLEIRVNAENYKMIVEIFKKALLENGMGFDSKDERFSGNPNQMNIQSMFSDLDNDADEAETEYQAAMEDVIWFVRTYLAGTGQGNFEGQQVEIIFNRDAIINESEKIGNCQKSMEMLSHETVIENHPWVRNVQKEIGRMEKEQKKEQEEAARQYDPFRQQDIEKKKADGGRSERKEVNEE